MSTSDKLSINTVIAQVLVEEKSRQTSNGQSALVAKGPNKSKNKDSKSKDPKSKKTNQKKCSYCKRTGHDKKECWKRKAEEADKSKAAGEKEKPKEKTDLSAKVAHMSSDQESPLQLFVVWETQKGVHASNWIVDLGASANMTCQRETFITFCPLSPPERVIIGDGRSIDAVGIGRIKLKVHVGNSEYKDTILRDVYYVPELHANLLSVPRLTKQGLGVTFDENTCTILANGKVAALASSKTRYIYFKYLQMK